MNKIKKILVLDSQDQALCKVSVDLDCYSFILSVAQKYSESKISWDNDDFVDLMKPVLKKTDMTDSVLFKLFLRTSSCFNENDIDLLTDAIARYSFKLTGIIKNILVNLLELLKEHKCLKLTMF